MTILDDIKAAAKTLNEQQCNPKDIGIMAISEEALEDLMESHDFTENEKVNARIKLKDVTI